MKGLVVILAVFCVIAIASEAEARHRRRGNCASGSCRAGGSGMKGGRLLKGPVNGVRKVLPPYRK